MKHNYELRDPNNLERKKLEKEFQEEVSAAIHETIAKIEALKEKVGNAYDFTELYDRLDYANRNLKYLDYKNDEFCESIYWEPSQYCD